MRSKKLLLTFLLVLASLFLVAGTNTYAYEYESYGAITYPDYDWWYGCSPTSAGMLMAFYDINGYNGLTYDNLVPGTPDPDTYPEERHGYDYAVNDIIASPGHIADFWTGYGNSGDDPLASGRTNPDDFDSLADYMGTSQDNLWASSYYGYIDASDGGTYFWYDGSLKVTPSTIEGWDVKDASGMYGIYEYITAAGYGVDIFNQRADTQVTGGFSFFDYMAEIDAGRAVLLHLTGHTVFAFGYEYNPTTGEMTVIFHDTWGTVASDHSMLWDGLYNYYVDGQLAYSGEVLMATALTLSGGDVPGVVPEPSTMILLGIGLLGTAAVARRKKGL